MKCRDCGQEMQQIQESYPYTESGLDNVYLEGIPVYRCSNDHVVARIPRPAALSDAIADAVLSKSSRLTGPEIRYLRKHLRLKAKEFAKQLGVDKTTYSRWEHKGAGPHADKLIRATYAAHRKHPELAEVICAFSDIDSAVSGFHQCITMRPTNGHYEIVFADPP